MRYMLMMNAPRGDGDWQVMTWSPADLKAHIAFMRSLNVDLEKAGELVTAEGLAAPGVPATFGEMRADEDDSLVLLFMCCHPALTASSAIALTRRAVGGLTTAEIANAFFTPEATMAQRISRAKQSIKTSKIPFAMPTVTNAWRRCCTFVSDLQRGIREQRRRRAESAGLVERSDSIDADASCAASPRRRSHWPLGLDAGHGRPASRSHRAAG